MEKTVSYDSILAELDIRSDPFALCSLEGACSLGLDRTPGATLHYVLGGTGQVTIGNERAISLEPGRLVLVPACIRHSLRNFGMGQTGLPACEPAGLNLVKHIQAGTGQGNMIILCSHISLSLRGTHGLVDMLRAPISIDVRQSKVARRAMIGLIREMTTPRLGRSAMIRTLLLECMIEMLRNRMEARDPSVMWLGGLADPGLWNALRAMLDDPGAPHSLEALAAEAGMSRSRFAERFQRAYDKAPMAFLRDLRLARAAQLLTEGQEPVERVAQKMGFASRSAFTRAFTAVWGQSPRGFRKTQDS